MHESATHPNVLLELAETHSQRPIRLDQMSDAALLWSKAQLSVAGNQKDATSCSLVVRRAIRLYERYLCTLIHDDGRLSAERKAVHALSQMAGTKHCGKSQPRGIGFQDHPLTNKA